MWVVLHVNFYRYNVTGLYLLWKLYFYAYYYIFNLSACQNLETNIYLEEL